jgi:hypothetical protein
MSMYANFYLILFLASQHRTRCRAEISVSYHIFTFFYTSALSTNICIVPDNGF